MRKILSVTLYSLILLFGSPLISSAVLIDFTDGNLALGNNSQNWTIVNGLTSTSATVDGINVNISTNVGTMTFNGYEGPGSIDLGGGYFLDGDGDGVGVRNWGDSDELNASGDFSEVLTVTFDPGSIITNIYILDLFSRETAVYTLDTDYTYTAPSNVAWGFHNISISNDTAFGSISFSVIPPGSPGGDDGDHDFAVAGIMAEPVPEPTTMLLFGTGLAGLAGSRLRRKKK